MQEPCGVAHQASPHFTASLNHFNLMNISNKIHCQSCESGAIPAEATEEWALPCWGVQEPSAEFQTTPCLHFSFRCSPRRRLHLAVAQKVWPSNTPSPFTWRKLGFFNPRLLGSSAPGKCVPHRPDGGVSPVELEFVW